MSNTDLKHIPLCHELINNERKMRGANVKQFPALESLFADETLSAEDWLDACIKFYFRASGRTSRGIG